VRAARAAIGVAYKKNVDDIREVRADVIRLLQRRGAQFPITIPTCRREKDSITLPLCPHRRYAARRRCVMIITDHSSLDYQLVKRHARATVVPVTSCPRDRERA